MIEQEYNNLTYLQFEQLRPFTHLTHGIFTRHGGYSEGPYHGLNTSALSGKDNYKTVARNRALTLEALNIAPSHCVTLWQVHGAEVKIVNNTSEWRTDWANSSYWEQPWQPHMIRKGDALITNQPGVALAVSFADCTPILFYDPVHLAIGIAHGGWRGTARGIVAATITAMQQHFSSKPEDLLAQIGPAIGPCCYEVSEQVQDIFQGDQLFESEPTPLRYRKLVRESAIFTIKELPEKQSLRLDLPATNHNQLLLSGVRAEHIENAHLCTSCHTEQFFSHRAEQGRTGRFPAILMIKET